MLNNEETKLQLRLAADSCLRWVLDKGYVKLVDYMGSDLSVVNAARVSFAKESKMFEAKDEKLISYLIKHGHTSPFRHAFLTFEVKAPLFVARQWWKYVVGSDHTMDGWNEVSRRYVADEPEFYIPTEWRAAPENKKQGSSAEILNSELNLDYSECLKYTVSEALEYYEEALVEGICAEQARLFLPAYAMYTTWRWSASLQSVMHFITQRSDDSAQFEIQQYASKVTELTKLIFPHTVSQQ